MLIVAYIYHSNILELTNQIALAFAKFEEIEDIHSQREQETAVRESDLRRSAEETAEESQKRFADMYHQLERTQSSLRELTAQHKSTTIALTEVII